MPTPPMPGWKLPLAVGSRSPIFIVALALSTARICGACNTFVFALLIAACNRALGRVVAKSALEMRPRLESGTKDPLVLLLVVVPVPVVWLMVFSPPLLVMVLLLLPLFVDVL